MQVLPWKFVPVRASRNNLLLHPLRTLGKSLSCRGGSFLISYGYSLNLRIVMNSSEKLRKHVSVHFARLVVAVLLFTTVSVAVSNTASCELALFL